MASIDLSRVLFESIQTAGKVIQEAESKDDLEEKDEKIAVKKDDNKKEDKEEKNKDKEDDDDKDDNDDKDDDDVDIDAMLKKISENKAFYENVMGVLANGLAVKAYLNLKSKE